MSYDELIESLKVKLRDEIAFGDYDGQKKIRHLAEALSSLEQAKRTSQATT